MLRFVYLLQAGERNFSPHIHTTWEVPFSASLYLLYHTHTKQDFIAIFMSLVKSVVKRDSCGKWMSILQGSHNHTLRATQPESVSEHHTLMALDPVNWY